MRAVLLAGFLAVLLAFDACSPIRFDLPPSALDGYRVVYRIEDRALGQRPSVATEVVEVRRPFDGRVEERSANGITAGRVTSRSDFWQLGPRGRLRFGVLRPPGGPTRDASIVALSDAAGAGVVRQLGRDRVLGRVCEWFAYRDPAPEALALPESADRIESCVDAGGVVLREVWTLHGRAARIVDAVAFDPTPPPASRFLEGRDPQTTKVDEPKGAELVGTFTQSKDVDPIHAPTPLRLDVPGGWRRDRATVVGSVPGQGAAPTQFLAQSFVRGSDLVVVETASAPHLPPPWPISQGKRVRIGVGEARVVFFIDRVEIRLLSAIGYARVVAPSTRIAFDFVRGLGAR